jgi:hypothetical protein
VENMNLPDDWSHFVAFGVPALGLILAWAFGAARATSGGTTIVLAALGVAVALGLVLTFGQVVLYGSCVGSRLCPDRGDGNMSYWFQSFFAIPLYWAFSCAAWGTRRK